MSFLYRKHCCLFPFGWRLILKRSLSSIAAILKEWMTDVTNCSFCPWRRCLARSSVPGRFVFFLLAHLFYGFKTTLCPNTSNLLPTGICPYPAEPVGVWLPGHPDLWLPDCIETWGALAWHPLLLGQPAHGTGTDQLPGQEKREGASRWVWLSDVNHHQQLSWHLPLHFLCVMLSFFLLRYLLHFAFCLVCCVLEMSSIHTCVKFLQRISCCVLTGALLDILKRIH